VIEWQLRGIYKIFIRLGSPEFVIRRIAAVHSTYFEGVDIIAEMKGPNSAAIQYVGFTREHRIIGFAIIGFSERPWRFPARNRSMFVSEYQLKPVSRTAN